MRYLGNLAEINMFIYNLRLLDWFDVVIMKEFHGV